jgi:hypothetical protein
MDYFFSSDVFCMSADESAAVKFIWFGWLYARLVLEVIIAGNVLINASKKIVISIEKAFPLIFLTERIF